MESIDPNHGPNSPNQPSDAAVDETTERKILGGYRRRAKSSKYRGVSMIKDKGTYEANVYDNGCKPKRRRTIYLGRFEKEEDAARAHDLASLKFWGTAVQTNFPLSDYAKELERMKNMTKQDVFVAIRRASDRFAWGKSKHHGVERNNAAGNWKSRKGQGKNCFFGSYDTEQEAAVAFDIATIKKDGRLAITNFDLECYDVEAIRGSKLPVKDEAQKGVVKAPVASRVSLEAGTFKFNLGQECRQKKQKSKSRQSIGNQGLKIWALETSRKDLADRSGSSFQHGTSSPFCSYQEMIEKHHSRALNNETSFFGFRHASSSAFQSYKRPKLDESSNKQEPNFPLRIPDHRNSDSLPPYQIDFVREQELRAQGLGFQHSSSSCFKPLLKQS